MGRPLDKQEAIPYGHFVDALYAMFKRERNLPARAGLEGHSRAIRTGGIKAVSFVESRNRLSER